VALADNVKQRFEVLSDQDKKPKRGKPDGSITARIPRKLKQDIKVYCAKHGVPMQDFVIEALQARLHAKKQ